MPRVSTLSPGRLSEVVLVTAVLTLSAHAQLYTGSIAGAVTDSTGAVVQGAKVVATDNFKFPTHRHRSGQALSPQKARRQKGAPDETQDQNSPPRFPDRGFQSTIENCHQQFASDFQSYVADSAYQVIAGLLAVCHGEDFDGSGLVVGAED